MPRFEPHTILVRREPVDLTIDAAGAVRLRSPVDAQLGPWCLPLLWTFDSPCAASLALDRLAHLAHGAQDWLDLTTTLDQLIAAGAIMPEEDVDGPPGVHAPPGRFDTASAHVRLLDDTHRTEAFLRALEATIRPGDVVVDLGTGTGLFAATAARLGARRVFAVEATRIADVADAMFRHNGVADRVELLRGWSTRLDPPERADVLVSEIIGHDPLAERVLEATIDARRRWLKQGARQIPNRIRIVATAVTMPRRLRARHTFTTASARRWQRRYNLDFGPLVGASDGSAPRIHVHPSRVARWRHLTPPVEVASLDLTTVTSRRVVADAVCPIASTGTLDGIALAFELELARGERISTLPDTTATGSWNNVVFPVAPLDVRCGQRIALTYRHRGGEPTTIAVTPESAR